MRDIISEYLSDEASVQSIFSIGKKNIEHVATVVKMYVCNNKCIISGNALKKKGKHKKNDLCFL